MSIIKVSKGEVTIKDKYTRADKRAVNQMIFKKINVKASELQNNDFEINAALIMEAEDETLLYLTEKITIDGKDNPINQDTLDDEDLLTDDDLVTMKAAVQILTAPAEVKKK